MFQGTSFFGLFSCFNAAVPYNNAVSISARILRLSSVLTLNILVLARYYYCTMSCSVLGRKKSLSPQNVINFTLEKPEGISFSGTIKGKSLSHIGVK